LKSIYSVSLQWCFLPRRKNQMDQPGKPTQEQQKAYDAGARAFKAEGDQAKNPHAEGSDAAKYWGCGFLDAQKASRQGG
jgi:hypothetical protein